MPVLKCVFPITIDIGQVQKLLFSCACPISIVQNFFKQI